MPASSPRSIDVTPELPREALAPLLQAARAESFRALDVLLDEWARGTNRFDRPGEALFVARVGGDLVGVGGLNRDPTRDGGRVRRLFVLPTHRRRGVGRALLASITARAAQHFPELVLRTFDPTAAAFYEALGFFPERGAAHTHRKVLGPRPGSR